MSQLITIQVPQDWIKGIPEEELTLKEIFYMGIHEYKIKRAIQLYLEGMGSVGYIAEKMDLLKQDLIQELCLRNIDPEFSQTTLDEEFS